MPSGAPSLRRDSMQNTAPRRMRESSSVQLAVPSYCCVTTTRTTLLVAGTDRAREASPEYRSSSTGRGAARRLVSDRPADWGRLYGSADGTCGSRGMVRVDVDAGSRDADAGCERWGGRAGTDACGLEADLPPCGSDRSLTVADERGTTDWMTSGTYSVDRMDERELWKASRTKVVRLIWRLDLMDRMRSCRFCSSMRRYAASSSARRFSMMSSASLSARSCVTWDWALTWAKWSSTCNDEILWKRARGQEHQQSSTSAHRKC